MCHSKVDEITTLKQSHNTLKSEISKELTDANDFFNNKMSMLFAKLQSNQRKQNARIDSLEHENTKLKDTVAKQSGRIDSLEQENTKLKAIVAKQSSRIEALEHEVKRIESWFDAAVLANRITDEDRAIKANELADRVRAQKID